MAKLLNRPRKEPKQERSSETVASILEASVRIFSGAKSVAFSTRTVAELAGISVGSLYQYFPNKESLVGALIDREAKKHIEQVEHIFATENTDDLAAVTERVVLDLVRDVHRNKNFLKGILKSVFHVERLETVIANRQRAVKFISDLLVNRKLEPDARLAYAKAYVVTAAVGGIVETMIFRDDEVVSVEEIAEHTTQMIIKLFNA